MYNQNVSIMQKKYDFWLKFEYENFNGILFFFFSFLTAIYGGFARSCIAKTMEDNIENEYVVTDENGCATDPSIFGEWEYSAETNSLLASFNAFKFPSSNNIRFQCNIRVCFGRCQPVNCRGYNAFGKRRRRREIGDTNSSTTSVSLPTEDRIDGQLREEITISSNAILTFEKKDERFSDGSDSEFFFCISHFYYIYSTSNNDNEKY